MDSMSQLIPSCSVFNKYWSSVMLMVDSVLSSGTGWLVSVPKPTGLDVQALASLELAPQLPSKRKASGFHASWLKLGKTGFHQKFPMLCCVIQAFFSRHGPYSDLSISSYLFLHLAVLLSHLCWSGCSCVFLVNSISKMMKFKKQIMKFPKPRKQE